MASGGGLTLRGPMVLRNVRSNEKIYRGITGTDRFSIATWFQPATLDQYGPARIVSFSESPFDRNFTIGQEGESLHFRVRNLFSSRNGIKWDLKAKEARVIYSRAKIWLVASQTEGFSCPVLEAMACGCVVISTDTYGGRELIRDGENGLLIPRGDTEGFVRAITGLLKDPEKEKRLAKAGLESAGKHSWEQAADKMEAVLKQLSLQFGDGH